MDKEELRGGFIPKRISNDFSRLRDSCALYVEKQGKVSMKERKEMQDAINSVFDYHTTQDMTFGPDSSCENFIVTENTDKMFFGVKVMPSHKFMDRYLLDDILFEEKPVRIKTVDVEFDSKMFSPLVGMTANEMMAVILYEVGHVVNSSAPVDDLRVQVDAYCAANDQVIANLKDKDAIDFMAFAVAEYISKHSSLFTNSGDKFTADEFIHYADLDDQLENLISKIAKNNFRLHEDVDNPFATMLWTLRILSSLSTRKIMAIKTLKKAIDLSASVLEQNYMKSLIRGLEHVRIIPVNEGALHKFKYNTMKQFDEDYFEIAMRCKNVEEEDDAIYLMRKINTRVSIIDDYINTEKISPDDFKKWSKLLDKYKDLRDDLLKTTVYKGKQYGVFVNYPDIVPNRY
jgi:hypothetical protein